MKDDILRELYTNDLSTEPESLRNMREYREAKEVFNEYLSELLHKKYEDVEILYDDIMYNYADARFCENRECFVLGWKLGSKFTLASFCD